MSAASSGRSGNFHWFRYDDTIDSARHIASLKDSQHRALLKLWLLAMKQGPLDADLDWLAKQTRRRKKEVKAALDAAFILNEAGQYVCPWLEKQRAKAEGGHQQRVDASASSARKRKQTKVEQQEDEGDWTDEDPFPPRP